MVRSRTGQRHRAVRDSGAQGQRTEAICTAGRAQPWLHDDPLADRGRRGSGSGRFGNLLARRPNVATTVSQSIRLRFNFPLTQRGRLLRYPDFAHPRGRDPALGRQEFAAARRNRRRRRRDRASRMVACIRTAARNRFGHRHYLRDHRHDATPALVPNPGRRLRPRYTRVRIRRENEAGSRRRWAAIRHWSRQGIYSVAEKIEPTTCSGCAGSIWAPAPWVSPGDQWAFGRAHRLDGFQRVTDVATVAPHPRRPPAAVSPAGGLPPPTVPGRPHRHHPAQLTMSDSASAARSSRCPRIVTVSALVLCSACPIAQFPPQILPPPKSPLTTNVHRRRRLTIEHHSATPSEQAYETALTACSTCQSTHPTTASITIVTFTSARTSTSTRAGQQPLLAGPSRSAGAVKTSRDDQKALSFPLIVEVIRFHRTDARFDVSSGHYGGPSSTSTTRCSREGRRLTSATSVVDMRAVWLQPDGCRRSRSPSPMFRRLRQQNGVIPRAIRGRPRRPSQLTYTVPRKGARRARGVRQPQSSAIAPTLDGARPRLRAPSSWVRSTTSSTARSTASPRGSSAAFQAPVSHSLAVAGEIRARHVRTKATRSHRGRLPISLDNNAPVHRWDPRER